MFAGIAHAARQRRQAVLGAEFVRAARTVDEWIVLCDGAGIPSGPILNVAEALAHPQVQARGMVVPLEHPTAGPVRVLGTPYKLAATPAAPRGASPTLGQHTGETLAALGYGADEIEALIAFLNEG